MEIIRGVFCGANVFWRGGERKVKGGAEVKGQGQKPGDGTYGPEGCAQDATTGRGYVVQGAGSVGTDSRLPVDFAHHDVE